MERRSCWMFGNFILTFCVLSTLFVHFCKVEAKQNGKVKRIQVFHRHHDCIVTFYHNGHIVNSTLDNEGKHLDTITAQFVAFGRQFVVDLHLNKQLFSGAYVEKVYHSHGRSSETNHISRGAENCYYHGRLRFQTESEAALSTCGGLSGYITDKHDTYHIEPVDGRVHRIYRNRDMRSLPFKCGTEGHDPRLLYHKSIIGRHKRSIRAPYDSNKNTRYVELYLVNDYRTYERHGKNEAVVIRRSQMIANIVSSLYRQLNIYVALVGVEVWTGGDLVSITTSADNTMENFLRYRKERINPFHHNDNAQLITGVFFDHGVVGKAIKGPICTHQFSGGVNMDYGGIVTLVATTVAHEMGHNFGMEHDNDTMCDCRDDKCIMAATSGKISPRKWSSCSQNALAEAFDLGMEYCLRNLPTTIYDGPICGNGFKEDGEECDCGLPEDCSNRCCNATSCKLYPLAQCATGRCCNLDECKPKPASILCREPVSECDLAEFCNGSSEYCPEDVHLQNGIDCKDGQSYCYNGQCNTHTDQCKLLWGETGRVSDPICFQQLNMNGNNDGNCGYNWTTGKYQRCDKEDVMCGLLHCVHLNEKLMFWRDNLAIDMRASFLSRGNDQHVCRSAMLDVGLDMPDPGFVPDGAKCEPDKVCISQHCVPLAKLKIERCPGNCDGHGRCNSKGHCHCDIGYAPPLCDRPGYGGSVDSGPASDEYAKKDLLIALLVVFLLIIPLIVLGIIAFLNRRRLVQWWKLMPSVKYRVRGKKGKPKPPPQPPQPNPNVGQGRKEFSPPSRQQECLISNPMLNHSTHTSDVHPKPKIWESKNTGSHRPAPMAPPPPGRPASSPKRPPTLAKSNSSSDSKNVSKKVRLSIPIQETGGPPSPSSKQKLSDACVTSMTGKQEAGKNLPPSPKANPIVKRESFRGSEISDPILVCTTNRNSLVLADGKVDIIGPEARSPPLSRPNAITVKRSQSERPVSRPDPISIQPPTGGTLKKSASTRSPTRLDSTPAASFAAGNVSNAKSNISGFKPRPVPPIPTYEEDDTQPIYTNESSDMSDLLSAIEGALKDSSPMYTNLSSTGGVHSPIQETAPPAPPRPPSRIGSTQQSSSVPGSNDKAASSVPRSNNSNSTVAPKKNVTDSNSKTKVSNPVSSSTAKQTPGPKPSVLGSSNPSPATNIDKKASQPSSFSSSDTSAKKFGAGSDDKKTVPSSKPNLSSESSSMRLKGAVSDELKNKILHRSSSSAGQAANSNSPLQKPSVGTASSSGAPPPKTTSSTPAVGKPTTNSKVSSGDIKPATKTVASSGQPTSSKPLASKITSQNSDTGSKSAGGPNRPTRSSSKTNADTAATAGTKASSGSSAVSGRTTPSAGVAKSNSRSSSRDGAKSPTPKPTPAVNSVTSLAAKFSQSTDDKNKPSTGLRRVASQSSEDDSKKKAPIRKVSDTEKPSIAGKPKAASVKSATLERPVSRVKSMTVDPKPSLPPKPGGEQRPTSPPATTPNAQPKRVQSYRI